MNVKPIHKVTLRRPIGKHFPIDELYVPTTHNSAAGSAWLPISLFAEIALDKSHFAEFSDLPNIKGWTIHPRDRCPIYEYCLVEIYESDTENSNDDDEDEN